MNRLLTYYRSPFTSSSRTYNMVCNIKYGYLFCYHPWLHCCHDHRLLFCFRSCLYLRQLPIIILNLLILFLFFFLFIHLLFNLPSASASEVTGQPESAVFELLGARKCSLTKDNFAEQLALESNNFRTRNRRVKKYCYFNIVHLTKEVCKL